MGRACCLGQSSLGLRKRLGRRVVEFPVTVTSVNCHSCPIHKSPIPPVPVSSVSNSATRGPSALLPFFFRVRFANPPPAARYYPIADAGRLVFAIVEACTSPPAAADLRLPPNRRAPSEISQRWGGVCGGGISGEYGVPLTLHVYSLIQ